ncbi:glycoside hydrolase family 38 protein [Lanmaoa asiatica]|nr:glycoside hydrolase family 38 protein [Lanmaoa asiatica]
MAHSHGCGHYPELNYGSGAKWIKNLTQNRLSTFLGGHFQDVNLSSVLYTHRLDGPKYVDLQVWSAPGLSKPLFKEAIKETFKPAKKGDSFGPSFEFDPGCEAMIFTPEGLPLQGLSRGSIHRSIPHALSGITGGYGGDRRVEHIIPREAVEQGTYEVIIESSCNGMFGVPWSGDMIAPPDTNRYFNLASADIVVPNQDACMSNVNVFGILIDHLSSGHLMWDFTTLREIVDTLPGNTPLQNKALVTANAIMNAFETGDSENIKELRGIAEDVFGKRWREKGADIYQQGPEKAQIVGISYCHIDTAWLWPYRVTQQKTARSWSTQVDLMERYPEHRFACSQAQQFKWLEQQYPPLFKKIQEKVASGQFHLIGGAWVENDGNMPSGEALVRQFVYGQRYFESRFGQRCETAWLPDSFGLTAAYPQLIRDSGMKYFFTQKLSWNNVNVFPHSTFNWVGIDGTQVLCHMTPVGKRFLVITLAADNCSHSHMTDTYTAQATVGDVNKGVSNHKNLESSDSALLVFGNGDGGGGALPKMLENLRRIRAVSNTHRELPSVSMGSTVEQFFEDIERESKEGKTLPVWCVFLYPHCFHRGTYTSHGSIKKGNRKSEILLRDVEVWKSSFSSHSRVEKFRKRLATLATLFKSERSSYVYPKATIDDCWEKVLLNQSLNRLFDSGMVYDDAEQLYSEVRKDCHILLEDALSLLLSDSVPLSENSSISQPFNVVAVNTTPFARRDIIKIPLSGSGQKLLSKPAQTSVDGKDCYVLLQTQENEILAQPATVSTEHGPVSAFTNGSDHFILRSSSLQLTISQGRITSLYDVKLKRELLQKGSTGGLVIFEDRPNYWDAWDVEIHHLEKPTPLEFSGVRVIAEGSLRAAVQTQVKYGESTIDVTVRNANDVHFVATTKENSRPLFTFDAKVDWHERHKILKFELPLDINNTVATYESQFGWVQRPTHKNTTLDAAKFEVCGHKFADFSEYGYGVALLSESKYGYACEGNVLRLSLLRAATAPDAEQDQGTRSPFWLEGSPNVFLETIKRGEDDDFESKSASKTVILRLYEAFGGHGRVQLRISPYVRVVDAYLTNLLEDHKAALSFVAPGVDANVPDAAAAASRFRLDLDFRGFEVKTVKLVIADGNDPECSIG